MKKLLSILLTTMLFLLPLAIAEGINFAAMTDDELQAVIDGAKSEQAKRQPEDGGDDVIINQDGVTVTLTGNNHLDEYSPTILDVEAIIENNSDSDVIIYMETASINDWNVSGSGLPPASAGKKVKGNFELWLDDSDVTAVEDVETIEMELYIYEADAYKPISDAIPVAINLG